MRLPKVFLLAILLVILITVGLLWHATCAATSANSIALCSARKGAVRSHATRAENRPAFSLAAAVPTEPSSLLGEQPVQVLQEESFQLNEGDTQQSSVIDASVLSKQSQATDIDVPNNSANHEWPRWLADYFKWHAAIRAKFPGDALFTHPDAPKLLIRLCLGLCGGLNDRLGQLPMDLYLANQTKRVLLISWMRPYPLERFLVPNTFDWTIPATQNLKTFQGGPRTSMTFCRFLSHCFSTSLSYWLSISLHFYFTTSLSHCLSISLALVAGTYHPL